MVVLIWFVNNTKAGHAMLAVSEDRGAAQLMGVNVNATISLTFAIGSALAAIAGALLCSSYPTLTPMTGAMPGIKAFVAAVFGGIGSIPGAFIGGILLGHHRESQQGIYFHPAFGCDRFSRSDRCPAGKADRTARQEDQCQGLIQFS
jgi:branched-subunit amino acid ABC-type transport system permease component